MIVDAQSGPGGSWQKPFVPEYPGRDRFRGRQLHSARYRLDQATALYRAQQEGRPAPEPASLGDVVMVEPVREARERGVLRSVRPFERFTDEGVVWTDRGEERIDLQLLVT